METQMREEAGDQEEGRHPEHVDGKEQHAKRGLGWLSWMIQTRDGVGMNDSVACRTMPSSRAQPLTASSACKRSGAGATSSAFVIGDFPD